jgi:hypothetical protein
VWDGNLIGGEYGAFLRLVMYRSASGGRLTSRIDQAAKPGTRTKDLLFLDASQFASIRTEGNATTYSIREGARLENSRWAIRKLSN